MVPWVYSILIGTLSKPRWRRQRGRDETKDLTSSTIAQSERAFLNCAHFFAVLCKIAT